MGIWLAGAMPIWLAQLVFWGKVVIIATLAGVPFATIFAIIVRVCWWVAKR